MRDVSMPHLSFPAWRPWHERGELEGVGFPGVYFLSLSNLSLAGEVPEWQQVSYIGMTNAKGGLASRWRQFDRAVRGKGGHSGGNTIFADKGHRDDWEEDLFVTGMPVECDVDRASPEDLRRMGWVAYLEYESFAEYRAATGEKPPFNKQ